MKNWDNIEASPENQETEEQRMRREVLETRDNVKRFLSSELKSNPFASAAESQSFEDYLLKRAQEDPEGMAKTSADFKKYFEQQHAIDEGEKFLAGLSKDEIRDANKEPETEGAAITGFFERKDEVKELESDLKALKEFEKLAKDPFVSFFSKLLIPEKARTKISEEFGKVVKGIEDKLRKKKNIFEARGVVVLTPFLKGMNEELKGNLMKNFFGAREVKKILVGEAEERFAADVEKHGEDVASILHDMPKDIFEEGMPGYKDEEELNGATSEIKELVEASIKARMNEAIKTSPERVSSIEEKMLGIITEAEKSGMDRKDAEKIVEEYLKEHIGTQKPSKKILIKTIILRLQSNLYDGLY